MQQKSLFNPKMINTIPITVRAMFVQEGFHQAKTITRAGRTIRQKQNDMIPPFLRSYSENIVSIFHIMSTIKMYPEFDILTIAKLEFLVIWSKINKDSK